MFCLIAFHSLPLFLRSSPVMPISESTKNSSCERVDGLPSLAPSEEGLLKPRGLLGRANLTLATGFFLSYLPACFRQGHRWTGAGAIGTLLGLVSLPFVPEGGYAEFAFLLLATGV